MNASHQRPRGIYSALPTLFSASGEVDLDSMRALMRWQRSPRSSLSSLSSRRGSRALESSAMSGVSGFVLYGTTGEAPTLSALEREVITRAARDDYPDVTLIAGVGSNCTATTVRSAQEARSWGADGGLVVTPYYSKPSAEGLYRHFATVAESMSDWPLTLYVVPGRAVINLDIDVVDRLLSDHPNIVAIKDASADLSYCAELISCCDGRASVLSGDDPTALAAWALGAQGSISVTSNLIPHEFVELWSLAEESRYAEARQLFLKMHPLITSLFIESNPTPLKSALATWGEIGLSPQCSDQVRLPLTSLTAESHRELIASLKRWLIDCDLMEHAARLDAQGHSWGDEL